MSKQSYKQVSITVSSDEQREILVALLADAGYEGFVEERNVLKAYVPADAYSDEALNDITGPMQLAYELEEIEQQNWNAQWEAGFEPVVVGDFCSIRADFHQPVVGTRYEIIITPKMSFGTGHHATTFMMVDSMQEIRFENRRVLDFGTGTGVLAILAEKMGAKEILAIDNDPWSIDNAGENISRNATGKIILQLAESIPQVGKFDVILANINKHVILQQLATMKDHLAPLGEILISGLLQSDAEDLSRAIAEHGLTLSGHKEKQSWLCWRVSVKEKS
ncbi:50S ribosomal protein L11 methyltransferase [Flavihumibacter solisilvae]|uniref:Ribosomal protein L11 methyltransferase n=1 Tax=Flavihumibacter solisilvae TaxID=1349421 RepID=A0A0C1LEW1_9BACT|nr:50S ribosomal protein L11 methyltransferase [Flavihumibacter solisilvae]KIC93918.1 hypothetical protein OI18_15150 [Flavihumibacter solisilvae]